MCYCVQAARSNERANRTEVILISFMDVSSSCRRGIRSSVFAVMQEFLETSIANFSEEIPLQISRRQICFILLVSICPYERTASLLWCFVEKSLQNRKKSADIMIILC